MLISLSYTHTAIQVITTWAEAIQNHCASLSPMALGGQLSINYQVYSWERKKVRKTTVSWQMQEV